MSLFLPASIANGNISNHVPFVVNFVDPLLVTLQICVFLRVSSPFMFKVLKTSLLFYKLSYKSEVRLETSTMVKHLNTFAMRNGNHLSSVNQYPGHLKIYTQLEWLHSEKAV